MVIASLAVPLVTASSVDLAWVASWVAASSVDLTLAASWVVAS